MSTWASQTSCTGSSERVTFVARSQLRARPFERGRVDGRLDDLGKSSVHLKNLPREGRKCVPVRATYCLPTRQASTPVRRCTPL